MRSKREKRVRLCPECGSTKVVKIVYGLPGPELSKAARRGKAAIGGCIVGEGQPTRECLECETRFLEASPLAHDGPW